VLNFIAIDLQLYKIFKITRVSFFGTHCMSGYAIASARTTLFFSLFSMRGRHELSHPVLRPPNGPNARPQENKQLT